MEEQSLNKAAFFDMIGYRPYKRQAEIHNSSARFRVVAAGARSGKSMLAGAEGAFALMLPNNRIWCVSTQYDLAEKEFDWALQFLDNITIGKTKFLSSCRISTPTRGSKTITTPWGSMMKTKSTEKASSLLGDELDLIILCEASQIARIHWESKLRARLGPRIGQLLACSTPDTDKGLFRDMYEWGQDITKPDWESWLFSVYENPTFSRAEYELAVSELDTKIVAEQYDGKFVSRRGNVFPIDVEPGGNVIQKKDPDTNTPTYVGIHYKPNNPISVTFLQKFEEAYVVYDEIHGLHSPKDALEMISTKIRGFSRFIGVYSDYWDVALKAEIEASGLIYGTNDEEKKLGKAPGLQKRVRALQDFLNDHGLRRLFIMEHCTKTIEAFQGVKWPDGRKEGSDKMEAIIPLDKYMGLPNSISYGLAFCESVSGRSIYT